MLKRFRQLDRGIQLYLIITATTGLALGLSDAIFANYFKEVYNVGAFQRGLIEFPRELPGMLCTLIIAGLAGLGDIKSAIIAQVLSSIGLVILGLVTPSFAFMLMFLFIFSLGQHLYLPLGDSIGLSLAKTGNVGKLIGSFNGVKTAFSMIAGIITFIGFKTKFFSFENPNVVFLMSAALFIVVAVILWKLHKQVSGKMEKTRLRLIFRKEYINYYFLCILFGARKQIMFVYSPWVLVDLLDFKTETMAILAVIGSFVGIFFMPLVGRWIDKFGVRRIMIFEALAFILIYISYGFLSAGIARDTLAVSGIAIGLAFLLNIVDRMTAQFGMVRSLYMRQIAVRGEDVTPSLSLGVSMDHVVSIAGSAVCGWVWMQFGPQYVFIIAAVMSGLNLLVAARIRPQAN